MSADFGIEITIKGTDEELAALLRVVRTYVVDKYDQYCEGEYCEYIEYPTLSALDEDGNLIRVNDDECLDEECELTEEYLSYVINRSSGMLRIEASGPYGGFDCLDDVGLFRDMIVAAPLSYIAGCMEGFNSGGDDGCKVLLEDGMCSWNGEPAYRVAIKMTESMKDIDGWIVERNNNAWHLLACAYRDIIEIPEILNGLPVVKICRGAFFSVKDKPVKQIIIPGSIEEIENGAFGELPNIDKVDPWGGLSDEMPESLESIIVAPDNANYCSVDGMLLNKEKTEILYCPRRISGTIVIPSTVRKLSIGQFCDRNRIAEIVLNSGIETIEAFAFYRCSFVQITIPGSVKKIGKYAFMESNVIKVVLEDGVEEIEEAFWMSSLEEIQIPSSVKYIANEAFGFLSGDDIDGFPSVFGAPDNCYASNYYARYLNGSLADDIRSSRIDEE